MPRKKEEEVVFIECVATTNKEGASVVDGIELWFL
jgi:hypothetical protein